MSVILKLKLGDAKRILHGNDHYWKVIRELTEADSRAQFTIADIDKRTNSVPYHTVRNFVKLLVTAGIAKKVGERFPNMEGTFRLLSRPLDTPVLSKTGQTTRGMVQQNLWNTMTYPLKRGFTTNDLALHASTDDLPITLGSARAYVKALNRAGMLIVFGNKVHPTYRVKPSFNTGPKAPKVLQSKVVFDANTETIIGDVIAEEVV